MIVADAKDYSSDLFVRGAAILALSGAMLIFSIYFVSGLSGGSAILPVLVIGSVLFLLTLFLFLKGRGMILHTPLRLSDEGVLIQPASGFHPVLVPYNDIASVELWWGLSYRRASRGCSVLSYRHGSVASVETFEREPLKKFIDSIKPLLEKKGLMLRHSDEDARSSYFAFQRDVAQKAKRW